MSGNTTAIERLLEVSNKLWDAMYESGEVPTHAERSYYYLALKDAMAENDILRKQVAEACRQLGGAWVMCAELSELVADMWRTMNLLDACAVDEYDEPMNCNTCEQWGHVDELASGARVIGCRLMWRMRELGIEVDE